MQPLMDCRHVDKLGTGGAGRLQWSREWQCSVAAVAAEAMVAVSGVEWWGECDESTAYGDGGWQAGWCEHAMMGLRLDGAGGGGHGARVRMARWSRRHHETVVSRAR